MGFMQGDIVKSGQFGIHGVVKEVGYQWVHGHNISTLNIDDVEYIAFHFSLVKRPIFNRIKQFFVRKFGHFIFNN